ncbi:MAG: hypothetical protein RBR53_11020 [Desulforegulaceae bacterium]|nr:hypothetical protein [Desulforegulaceae bacterium]
MINLRSFIRKSPLLYTFYLFLRFKGKYYKLPDRYTDIHITAFQRSGNTFAANLVKRVLPDKKIVTHIHTIASLKKALKYDIPVIVLIRDPKQSIPSSLLKRIEGGGGILGKHLITT